MSKFDIARLFGNISQSLSARTFGDRIHSAHRTSAVAKKRKRSRTCRVEELEPREMLAVTLAEFDAIKTQYSDLNLGEFMDDYHIIEVSRLDGAGENENHFVFTLKGLEDAIKRANETTQESIIVVRTSEHYRSIGLDSGNLPIINASADKPLTIVSYDQESAENGTAWAQLRLNGAGSIVVNTANNRSVPAEVVLAGIEITGATSSGIQVRGTGDYGHDSTATVTLVDCDIHNNGGTGIYVMSGSANVLNSVIKQNRNGGIFNGSTYTYYGDTYVRQASTHIVNSLVVENFRDYGAGLYNRAGSMTLVNCTIVGNKLSEGYSGDFGGVGIYSSGGTNTTLHNTIVVENVPRNRTGGNDIFVEGTLGGSRNLVGVVAGGNHNLLNPIEPSEEEMGGLFEDLGGWDLRLGKHSPAIDVGDNELARSHLGGLLTRDILGNPRPYNGIVDIGAYEYQGNDDPPPNVPDLATDNGGTLPTSVIKGNTFSVTTADITNIGTAASGNYTVTFYASESINTLFTSGIELGSAEMPSLAVDAATIASLNGISTALLNASPAYYIGWRITGVIGETVTDNNTGYNGTPMSVIEDPDDPTTELTGITVSTNSPRVGTAITTTLSPSGATATYQWYRNTTIITGATASTYTPVATDVGQLLRVVATGIGNYTGTVEHTLTNAPIDNTPDPVKPKIRADKKAATITTVTLNFTPPRNATLASNASYDIICTTKGVVFNAATQVTFNTTASGQITGAVISGLEPGKSYRFTLVAKNADGKGTITAKNGKEKSTAVKVSARAAKFTAVQKLKSDRAALTDTSASLTWLSSKANVGDASVRYEVVWVDGRTEKSVPGTVNVVGTTATITGLESAKKYKFVVRAIATVDGKEITSLGKSVSVKTLKSLV